MGTVASGSKILWGDAAAGKFEAIYVITFDTTDASGQQTIDLTSDFSEIMDAQITATQGTTGYVMDVEIPADGTAITSSNVKIGVYEAGADGAPLDALASTDISAVIVGARLHVWGKQAI